MKGAVEESAVSAAYRAARESLAHRVRGAAVLDVEGTDRESFLQGQLTQDVLGLAPGETRATAALTSRGKLLFVARLLALSDRFRLVLPSRRRTTALEHLRKYAAFQKVTVSDRSEEFSRIGLYGPRPGRFASTPDESIRLPGEWEFSAEILIPSMRLEDVERSLCGEGSVPVGAEAAEILRIEAGRPRFGQDADESNLPDEVGLEAAISVTKGCYVGQEIVARRRTYGRVNRRLVGYRFPDGVVPPGTPLRRPHAPDAEQPRTEAGRVTSASRSPRIGPIGLGFAFHDVPIGGRLVSVTDPAHSALVSALPFA